MAEVMNGQTSGNAAPVILNTPGSTPPAATPTPPSGQVDGTTFSNVDPSKLPPELQQLYRSMQGDYTRKTTELSDKEKQWGERERGWDTERQRYRTMEQQFQDLNRRVTAYAEQERRWNEWTPFLQAASQPGMMDRLLAVMQGRSPAGTGATTGEATVARLIEGLKDDDFVDGATLQRGLGQIKNMMQQEVMQMARGEMENYARQAVKAVADWVQNYQTLADQMMNLRLRHEFNMSPVADRRFDPQRVVETARQRGITDLDLAYQIAYGADDAARQVAAAQQVAAQERERIEKDAYERATKEAELRFRNQQAGLVSGDGVNLPKFERTRPSTYGDIERDLAEKLSGIGMFRR